MKRILLAAAVLLSLGMAACSGENEAERNLKAGMEFLEKNAKEEGVVVTESGLQYIIIEEGNGDRPTESDKVKCYYRGSLINGTVFDETKEGTPATMEVYGLIAGFKEALLLMPAGSKWKLFVPQYLGYGPYQIGGIIPPYSVLIFEIELLEII